MLSVTPTARVQSARCIHRAFSNPKTHRSVNRPACPSVSSELGLINNRKELLNVFVVQAKKGGKKGSGGGGKSNAKEVEEPKAQSGNVDLEKMAKDAKKDAEDRMSKAADNVTANFGTIRTGRANPLILDKVQVDYYGSPTPLKSLASVSVPDASTLRIAPFDKSALKDIERGILEADLGINPNNDGESIRLVFPPMTEERRKDLSKSVSKLGEEGKVAVRNVRKDVMKKFVDKYDFPKDTKKDLEGEIQKVTDKYIKKLEEMVKAKTDEVMKV